jgi:hypothetical protein
MSTYYVRDAFAESDSDILAEFMTRQAMETEGKTLDPRLIANGVRGLFARP